MKIIGFLLATAFAFQVGAQQTKAKLNAPSAKRAAATSAAPTVETGSSSLSVSEVIAEMPKASTNAAMSSANYFPALGAKNLVFTPVLTNATISQTNKTTIQSTQVSSLATEIKFQARANEKWALEFSNSFGNDDVSTTAKLKGSATNVKQSSRASGLGDLHVVAKTMKAQTESNVQFSVDLGLSPGISEVGTNTTDGNRYTGGVQFAPGLAYEQAYKDRVIGWKTAFNLKSQRSVEQRTVVGQPKARYTLDGGHMFSGMGFSEWQNKRNVFGLRAGLALVSEETTQMSDARPVSADPYQLVSGGLYGEKVLTSRTTLLPSLTFSSLFNRGNGTVDGYDALSFGLGARISL